MKHNLVILDEVSSVVGVISLESDSPSYEVLENLNKNKQFIKLIQLAVKEHEADEDATYGLGDIHYYSTTETVQVTMYQVYDENDTNTLTYSLSLTPIYE